MFTNKDYMKDYINLEKVSIQLLDKEIICTHNKSGYTIDANDAREIDNAQHVISRDLEVAMLVDIYNVDNKILKEAKEYFTKKGKMLALTRAVAIVQKSGQDNLPGGFFSGLIKPIYPVKTFETRQDALLWLREVN